MNTSIARLVLFVAVLFGGASGCIDFDKEGARFCQRYPERCPQASGNEEPTPDAGGPDTGGDAGVPGAPELLELHQSALSTMAQGSITLRVKARDAHGGPLGFSWETHLGTLETLTTTETTSETVWKAPACVPEGTAPTVKVTVTNAQGLSTSTSFIVFSASCVAYAAGREHSMRVRPDGTVWAWGNNAYGQLGDGTTTTRLVPVQVGGLSGVVAVAAGNSHSLAVRGDGTVWAWGFNLYGQVGDGTTDFPRPVPVQVGGLSGVVAVAAGSDYSLAVRGDGTVWAWGNNAYGQLGDGTTTHRSSPVQVGGLSGVVAVAAGNSHSLAVRSDGTVWAWGDNSDGLLGDGTPTTPRRVPVQVGGLSGVVAVGAGDGHSLAVRGDGTVWTWGYNQQGQLGDGTTTPRRVPMKVGGLSGVVAVGAGGGHSLAVRSDGTVWAWGANGDGRLGDGTTTTRRAPVQVEGLSGVVVAAAGWRHSMAVRGDGTVWAWGNNAYGQLGDGTTIIHPLPMQMRGSSGVVAVTSGDFHALAVRSDGTVWAWGDNPYGQLGDGTTVSPLMPMQVGGVSGAKAVAAGNNHSLAVRGDGTVLAWGDNQYGQLGDGTFTNRLVPVQVGGLSSVKAVAAGRDHSLVVRGDGTVWVWGYNQHGQLGDGTLTNRPVPVQVGGLSSVVAVAAGRMHSLALRSDGTVWAWGHNAYGQLGDGTTTNTIRQAPGQVGGLSGVVAVAAGKYHSLAVRGDGTVWAWGLNSTGQLGDGTTTFTRPAPVQVGGLSGVVAVAAGSEHSVAARGDGTVWAWGLNSSGELGDGTTTFIRPAPAQVGGMSGGVAVAAGWHHSLAVQNSGAVWGWGANNVGQLGEPPFSALPIQSLLP